MIGAGAAALGTGITLLLTGAERTRASILARGSQLSAKAAELGLRPGTRPRPGSPVEHSRFSSGGLPAGGWGRFSPAAHLEAREVPALVKDALAASNPTQACGIGVPPHPGCGIGQSDRTQGMASPSRRYTQGATSLRPKKDGFCRASAKAAKVASGEAGVREHCVSQAPTADLNQRTDQAGRGSKAEASAHEALRNTSEETPPPTRDPSESDNALEATILQHAQQVAAESQLFRRAGLTVEKPSARSKSYQPLELPPELASAGNGQPEPSQTKPSASIPTNNATSAPGSRFNAARRIRCLSMSQSEHPERHAKAAIAAPSLCPIMPLTSADAEQDEERAASRRSRVLLIGPAAGAPRKPLLTKPNG